MDRMIRNKTAKRTFFLRLNFSWEIRLFMVTPLNYSSPYFVNTITFISTLSRLLFFSALDDIDDDISLFVPFVDISMRLDNLFQRIASIYDRFYFSLFNKLFEDK